MFTAIGQSDHHCTVRLRVPSHLQAGNRREAAGALAAANLPLLIAHRPAPIADDATLVQIERGQVFAEQRLHGVAVQCRDERASVVQRRSHASEFRCPSCALPGASVWAMSRVHGRALHVFDMDGTLPPGTTASLEIARHVGGQDWLHALEQKFRQDLLDTRGFAAALHGGWS